MTKTYIHVNQHKIRANKKHGTNEPVITIKEGKKNTYCHEVSILGESNEIKKRLRVQLSSKVADVIKSAFSLLGIQVPNRM